MISLQAIFEFIPVLVGSVFAAVGCFSLKNFLSLRGTGSKVPGQVKAVEKYVSTRSGGGQISSSVMYRPVVAYTFAGRNREVRGLSVNQLRHHLGQPVEVLVRKNGDNGEVEAGINDSLNVGLGLLFLLLGLGVVGFGFTLETASPLVIMATLVLVLLAGLALEAVLPGPSVVGGGQRAAPRS